MAATTPGVNRASRESLARRRGFSAPNRDQFIAGLALYVRETGPPQVLDQFFRG